MADLRRILDSRGDDAEEALAAAEEARAAAPALQLRVDPHACEECEERRAAKSCRDCDGHFCELCFRSLHRKGRRAKHKVEAYRGGGGEGESEAEARAEALAKTQVLAAAGRRSMRSRARFIPLRLAYEERKLLRTVEAALRASDYVSQVDREFPSPAKRQHAQLRGICAFLCGLVTCVNYEAGQRLLEERCFADFEGFFQECVEILRRYKIMNPEKLRGEYGKLLYMMQDAMTGHIHELLGFDLKGEIKTVYAALEELDALDMLDDPLVDVATQEILPDRNKSRGEIQAEIRQKNRAVEVLVKRFCPSGSTRGSEAERIRLCLYSIADNNSFLNANRLPVDKTIRFLDKYFEARTVEDGFSLAIQEGASGARLTHSHERQFNFVRQSLKLWSEILNDFFRLWYLAEEDLLSGTAPYSLEDTGQGFQRVQQCPRTFRAMQEILFSVMEGVTWIGSSVVHLGDHNVPNALVFIDKYTQVSRILGPVVNTLEQMRRIYDEDPATQCLVDRGFDGLDAAEKTILVDFFRGAFDGSGADNFFDAGSCIDGRLTSAWNWCEQINSKNYVPLFHITGNQGFDGDFRG